MTTSTADIWEVIRRELPRGRWVDIQGIYGLVARHLELDDEDRAQVTPYNKTPTWHRNVRNVLQTRKGTGDILWAKDEPEYMFPLPTTETEESSLPNTTAMSEAEFRKLQQRREEIGRLGEELVVRAEKEDLEKGGKSDLAARVERVSVSDVGAGYDVLSFDLDGNERYIEVKSTTGSGSTFELTVNELDHAKVLGASYWIYFIRRVEDAPDIERIVDPASMIGKGLELHPSSYRCVIM